MPDGDAEFYDQMYVANDRYNERVEKWKERHRERALEALHCCMEVVSDFMNEFPEHDPDEVADLATLFDISEREAANWCPSNSRREKEQCSECECWVPQEDLYTNEYCAGACRPCMERLSKEGIELSFRMTTLQTLEQVHDAVKSIQSQLNK